MLADIRRRAHTEHVVMAPVTASPIREHTSTFQFTASRDAAQHIVVPSAATSELTAIKRDLVKTIGLAAVAITAELVLYWTGRGTV